MASKGPKSDAARPPVAKPVKTQPESVLLAAAPVPPVPAALANPAHVEPAASLPVPHVPSDIAAPIAPEAPAAPAATPVAAPAPAIPTPAAAPAAAVSPPVAAPAAASAKEDVVEAINEATDKTQAQAQAMFADANDRAKTAMEKGSKMIEDMNAFSKGNLEAVVESSKIAAKGAEDVARYTTDYARSTVEKANAAARQFAAVKSPTELFKLQSDLAKETMDQMMAETAKFAENYLKLLGEIAQPLSNRVAVAAEKMKIAA